MICVHLSQKLINRFIKDQVVSHSQKDMKTP